MKSKKIITTSLVAILLLAATIIFQSQTAVEKKPVKWSYITYHAQMGVSAGSRVFPNGVLDKINDEGYELTDILTVANDPTLPAYQTNVLFILRKKI